MGDLSDSRTGTVIVSGGMSPSSATVVPMIIRRPAFVVLSVGVVAALAACGGTSSSSGSASPSATESTFTAPANAAAVVTGMKAAGAPIKLTVTFTAASDENDLLGRPGQYTSKAAFKDTQVKDATTASKGDVELGGGVECFAQ